MIITIVIIIAASRLAFLLQSNGSGLSRSVSSVGEHESGSYTSPPLPKRAETFGGFDKAGAKQKYAQATLQDSDSRSSSLQNLHKQESEPTYSTISEDTASKVSQVLRFKG